MGKKEQLEQIVSLLASDKIIINQGGGGTEISFTQEELDELVPLFCAEMQANDSDLQYSYDTTSKTITYSRPYSDTPSKTATFESTITDVDSFMYFIGSFAWLGGSESETTSSVKEEVEALYSSYMPVMVVTKLFDGGVFSDLASNNRELVLEKFKSAYPLCIKILQIYLKLVQQLTN